MIQVESLSDKKTIWQIDEILLILFASGRFHTIEDLVLLTDIFEKLFPVSQLVGFKANSIFISRQIEILLRKKCIFSIGKNFGIAAQGRKYIVNLINDKVLIQGLAKQWQLYRKMLARLPRVRTMWDDYLEEFLTRLQK